MNCNLPKSWDRLPPKEKDMINKAMTKIAYDIVDQEQANLQENWIKLACILLHNYHNFDEEELLQFIAEWNRIYRRNERLDNKESQQAWMNMELRSCFPNCGFPQMRIDDMKKG